MREGRERANTGDELLLCLGNNLHWIHIMPVPPEGLGEESGSDVACIEVHELATYFQVPTQFSKVTTLSTDIFWYL